MRRNVLLVAILALVLPAGARAQVAPLAPEQRQAIMDYKLSQVRAGHLITAMGEMTRYVLAQKDFKERMAKLKGTTPAQRLALIEQDTKAMAILRKNGLSAKEYVVGVPTLRMALVAASNGLREGIVASPANIQFAKTHGELKARMDSVDGIRPAK
jgi:hypothetical protein